MKSRQKVPFGAQYKEFELSCFFLSFENKESLRETKLSQTNLLKVYTHFLPLLIINSLVAQWVTNPDNPIETIVQQSPIEAAILLMDKEDLLLMASPRIILMSLLKSIEIFLFL